MALLLLSLLPGCGTAADTADTADTGEAPDTGDTADDTPGVLGLAFELDADLIEDMEEPPVGLFRGSIYAEAMATATGPVDDAVSLADLEVALDFTSSTEPTAVLWTSEPWPPQKLWVLGCLDSDANDCDRKDAVTIPSVNKLLLAAGGQTDFTVQLGILAPS